MALLRQGVVVGDVVAVGRGDSRYVPLGLPSGVPNGPGEPHKADDPTAYALESGWALTYLVVMIAALFHHTGERSIGRRSGGAPA